MYTHFTADMRTHFNYAAIFFFKKPENKANFFSFALLHYRSWFTYRKYLEDFHTKTGEIFLDKSGVSVSWVPAQRQQMSQQNSARKTPKALQNKLN